MQINVPMEKLCNPRKIALHPAGWKEKKRFEFKSKQLHIHKIDLQT